MTMTKLLQRCSDTSATPLTPALVKQGSKLLDQVNPTSKQSVPGRLAKFFKSTWKTVTGNEAASSSDPVQKAKKKAAKAAHKKMLKQAKAKGSKQKQFAAMQRGLSKHEMEEIKMLTRDMQRPSGSKLKIRLKSRSVEQGLGVETAAARHADETRYPNSHDRHLEGRHGVGVGGEGSRRKLVHRLASGGHANSSPNLVSSKPHQTSPAKVIRGASSPTLVKCIPTYVNRLKAAPFSLGEKLSRWCRASPMAIFHGHPPQDAALNFPDGEYRDYITERRADLEAAGHVHRYDTSNGTDDRARVESVLVRYAPGRHGLSPSAPKGTPAKLSAPALPPPTYKSPRDGSNAAPESMRPKRGETPPIFHPLSRGASGLLKHTPQPVQRFGSNVSLIREKGTRVDLFSATERIAEEAN